MSPAPDTNLGTTVTGNGPVARSALAGPPWLRAAPGLAGLLNAITRFLVDAPAAPGDPVDRPGAHGLRAIYDYAALPCGLSLAHTRSALLELEAYGVVQSTERNPDAAQWRATPVAIRGLIDAGQLGRAEAA